MTGSVHTARLKSNASKAPCEEHATGPARRFRSECIRGRARGASRRGSTMDNASGEAMARRHMAQTRAREGSGDMVGAKRRRSTSRREESRPGVITKRCGDRMAGGVSPGARRSRSHSSLHDPAWVPPRSSGVAPRPRSAAPQRSYRARASSLAKGVQQQQRASAIISNRQGRCSR